MAATPYPLPRETRESTILVGNGTAGPYGPTTFKVFDTADIEVLWKPSDATSWAKQPVTVAKAAGLDLDTVSVWFQSPVPASTLFVIRSARVHERSLAVQKGSGGLDADQLEKELSKQGSVIEELRRDVDDTVRSEPGQPGRFIEQVPDGHFWIADADGNMVDGGDGTDIPATILQALAQALAAVQALNFVSISALRSFGSATLATAADVVGYYSGTRLGGGRFSLDATDIVTADDGGNVIVDAAGRRWKRVNPQYQVTDFGARPYSSNVDAGPAFAAAQAAAVASGAKVVRASGEFLVNTSIPIAAGVSWETARLTLRTTATVINIFSAVAVDDWKILGGPVFRGTLAAPLIDFVAGSLIAPYATAASVTANPLQYDQTAPDDQNGIRIVDCRRFIVENPQGYDLAGACISRAHSAGAGTPRGDKGTIIAPFARNCVFGMISAESGAGAEYCSIVNPSITGCIVGDAMGAGNQTISGGSITDNWINKYVSGGAGNNHAHGVDDGVQLNHGVHLGILASSVTNGHSFVGCHHYGSGAGKGAIWFLDSRNVHVLAGVVDCYIYCDSGPNAGFNYVRDNHFQGDYGAVLLTQVTSGAELIVSTGNTGLGTNKDNNTPHPLYVLARRETSDGTQAATAVGTAIKFPTEISDRMQRYEPTTGVLAVPTGMDGTYRLEAHLVFGGVAVDPTASYVELKINGAVQSIALPAKFSTTILIFDFVEEMVLAAGDTLTLNSTIAAASGQVFGSATYRSTLSFAKIG